MFAEVMGEALPYILFWGGLAIAEHFVKRNEFRDYELARRRYSRQRMRAIRSNNL